MRCLTTKPPSFCKTIPFNGSNLTYHARVLSHYKAIVRKVGRHLYQYMLSQVDPMDLNAPLIKMKFKEAWEDWEENHPKMGEWGAWQIQRNYGRLS